MLSFARTARSSEGLARKPVIAFVDDTRRGTGCLLVARRETRRSSGPGGVTSGDSPEFLQAA